VKYSSHSSDSTTDLKTKLQDYKARFEAAMDALLPSESTRPARLHQAMRYSMESGGKRLRPALLLAAAELVPGKVDPLPAATAVECIHTYSLVHDDLPCMDDGDLRRGKPSCHKQFDEATAVLAGDALNTYAFLLLARHYRAEPALAADLIEDLAFAAGSERLIGGQTEDIEAELSGCADPEKVDYIHRNKTAALMAATLTMGGRLSAAGTVQIERLGRIGLHLGIAFQIVDDILDVTGDTGILGKTAGSDQAAEKATYVSQHGLDRSREEARRHTRIAIEECRSLKGDSSFLIELIRSLEHRIQ
jgi:geranylgeranyl diphosphate synthase, type II